MGFASVVRNIFRSANAPVDILCEWASEPLKSWEHKRNQEAKASEFERQEMSKDNDVRRTIQEKIGVEEVRSRLKREEDAHTTELQIRMQTEIEKMNAQTRQWEADQDAARRIKLLDAFKRYQKELMDLNTNAISAIGEMSIELKNKAQNLVMEKTKEYKALQDEAQRKAIEETDLIMQKYSNNERIMNMMLNATESKLVGIIDNCSRFINELNDDIKQMNISINRLTDKGQDHIHNMLSSTLRIGPGCISLNNESDNYKTIE